MLGRDGFPGLRGEKGLPGIPGKTGRHGKLLFYIAVLENNVFRFRFQWCTRN